MRIVFFGTPSFVIQVLQSLIENFDVIGIVTTPDVPAGRKKILTPTPVKQFAIEKNISTIITSQQFNNETIQQLSGLSPDLFVIAAYGHLIPKNVLKIPKRGSLNIHPSLLPKYRGPSPIQTAILSNDKETGVTIIEMDEQLDHGPIIAQEKIVLNGDETFESLHTRLFQLAAQILPTTMGQWGNGAIKAVPQDDSKATYYKKITKEDGYFDFDDPPEKDMLDRMIRAYCPWPTAWTKWVTPNGQWKILKFLPEKQLQIEGGKPMTMRDFLNGYPQLKERLEKLLT